MSETTFSVGEKIRSYDFEPRAEIGNCFVEGIIISIVDNVLTILVDRDVHRGEDFDGFGSRVHKHVGTAIELLLGEWEGRLVKLS
jgi:hypothetical protein